jgi:hypothetical protein
MPRGIEHAFFIFGIGLHGKELANCGRRRLLELRFDAVIARNSFALGNEQDFTEAAGILRKLDGLLITTYAARTGLSRERLDKMMSEETWLNATQARSLGFITSVITSGPAAKVPANRFTNAPAWIHTTESTTPKLDAVRQWLDAMRQTPKRDAARQKLAELRKS